MILKGRTSIVELKPKHAFAVWFTGLPASGKSTLATSLKAQLGDRGIDVAVLESDALRRIFTAQPRYDEQEREAFYRQMVYVGTLLTQHGVPVIFDATANRRRYRDTAREGDADSVPGLQAAYEPPEKPELIADGYGPVCPCTT